MDMDMDMDMDMGQQLDPKLANKTPWLYPEEEVGVDLSARHSGSRQPPNGVRATATSAGGEPPLTNGTIPETPDQQVEEIEDAPLTANAGHPNQVVIANGEGGGNSVYFDKVQGLWKCRHCNWAHQIGSPCIHNVQDPEGYLHMPMSTKTLNHWGLENKGTEAINEINGMQSEIIKIPSTEINHQMVKISENKKDFGLSPAPAEHLHEGNGSFKHFEHETIVDANVELIEDIEEDLVDLDVERVLDKQNTHDLYCPNCNSCITKRVILIRRRPKVSIRHKPKRGSKLDPVPNSASFGGSDDAPEIHSDVNAVAAPDEQNDSREQEAFSCLSCFSLFIPIGNGCFKIFQFFRWGRQTENTQSTQDIRQGENTQSTQEIRQRENTQRSPEIRQREHTGSAQGSNLCENTESPQGMNLSENTQSPQLISMEGKIQSLQGIIQNGNTETTQSPQKRSHNVDISSPQHINHNEDAQKPQEINWNEDTQSPQKISCDANMSSPQYIKHSEDAQKAQPISWNEYIQSPQKIRGDENAQSPKDINQNNSKQSPQKITTDRTNGIFSNFGSHKSKETAEKESSPIQAGHAISVQSAAVPPPSLINNGYIDGTAIKPKEPGTSNIFSSTNSSLLDKLKENSTEQKPDLDVFQRNVVNVLALGMANLIGGLIIICHNLKELQNEQPRISGASDIEEDRYEVLLGRRQNFLKHVIVAILSFLIFGLVPPVVYGFSFRKSDDKDLKLAAVAGASLICIFLLALGKGHLRRPHRAYVRSVSYYIGLGITASGISYVVGQLLKKLFEQLGLFESSSTASSPFLETLSMEVGIASY
ncbi:hypothetical protein V6N13_130547 [Hibiscus sabdariffa]|uniref:Membrane protein of ER body-like protein n=1 Tax=Hibiscus sabdariffa TaxID=183260 RepID=A0ABR2A6U4_9ROSI